MPLGPVATWSSEDKVKETVLQAGAKLGPEVQSQLAALVSPENITMLVATLAIWAASHFVGVGEVVDVALLLIGAAMIGPSIVDVVENLMRFGKCMSAQSDGDIERAATALAAAIVTGGITTVMALLLRKGAKSAQLKVSPKASWLEVAKPKGPIGLPNVGSDPNPGSVWSKMPVTGDASLPAGAGETTMFGEIVYSLKGSATEQQLVLLHEKVHAALSPRFGLLRTLRAQLKWAGYSRSVILKYLEEAMAESYAQLRVVGFKGLITGIKFPISPHYVSISELAAEGMAIGTIVVGVQRFYVSLIGPPSTWSEDTLPRVDNAPNIILGDQVNVVGGYAVILKSGQSLSAVANQEYGDTRLWPLIWDLNRKKIGVNPNRVSQGLSLLCLPKNSYSAAEINEAQRRAPTWKNYPL